MAAGATGPLAGVRVLDLSQALAGPYGTQILADQGADVIKVDLVRGGDPVRVTGTQLAPGITPWFLSINRNKRSVAIDAKTRGGIDVLLRLAAKCDVVYENFRPGAVDRMGIGYEACRRVNPDIIYLSSTGYGTTGPYSGQPVYDPLIQAVAGMPYMQRDYATGELRFVQTSVADKVAALTNAQAVTAALVAKRGGRGGTHIRTSMLDSFVAFNFADGMLNHVSLRPGYQPAEPELGRILRAFATKDGAIAMVAVLDKGFAGFCEAVEQPQLRDDARLRTHPLRVQNLEYLGEACERATRGFTTAELLRRLHANDVPSAPVNTPDTMFTDPQVTAAGVFTNATHPTAGAHRQAPHSARFAGMPAQIGRRHAPGAGEHTREVLREILGMPDGEIGRLCREGAVATPAELRSAL